MLIDGGGLAYTEGGASSDDATATPSTDGNDSAQNDASSSNSDGGSGSGRFVMDESNWAFSGTYNRGDNPDEVDATWNGNRPAGKGGKTPPVSFAGEWTGAVGEYKACNTARREMVDEMLHPSKIGIISWRNTKLPSHIFL